jgi:hypothetical protein
LNTRVRAAFERLIAVMQDVKDRYYKRTLRPEAVKP